MFFHPQNQPWNGLCRTPARASQRRMSQGFACVISVGLQSPLLVLLPTVTHQDMVWETRIWGEKIALDKHTHMQIQQREQEELRHVSTLPGRRVFNSFPGVGQESSREPSQMVLLPPPLFSDGWSECLSGLSPPSSLARICSVQSSLSGSHLEAFQHAKSGSHLSMTSGALDESRRETHRGEKYPAPKPLES